MASHQFKNQNLIVILVIFVVMLGIGFIWLKNNASTELPVEIGLSQACEEQAKKYIRKTEQEATELAQTSNKTYRITSRDNESYAMTMDYRPERLNFVINNNVVTGVTCE